MSRIRLTWNNASTTIVEQRVYRSISPLDIDDMPEPLAVLPRRSREYLDSTIEDGLTYYYAVSSVLPDYSELFSEGIKVEASPGRSDPHWDKVVALLRFDGDLTDEKGRVWARSGAAPSYVPSISEQLGSAIDFSGETHLTTTGGAEIRDWNMDWTIEFYFYPYGFPPSTNLAPFGSWRTSGDNRSLGFVYRHIPDSYHLRWSSTGRSTTGDSAYELHFDNKEALMDKWSHIAFCRKDGTVYGFVDGELKDAKPMPSVHISDEPFTIGATSSAGVERAIMLFDELRITKGVARYTENFDPPTEPFPNN